MAYILRGVIILDDKKNLNSAKIQMQKRIVSEKRQNISLENRERVILSGILNVESFNESQIVLDTMLGTLTIKGSGMHMSRLNVETGDLAINGRIDMCAYSEKQDIKHAGESFLSKLFK